MVEANEIAHFAKPCSGGRDLLVACHVPAFRFELSENEFSKRNWFKFGTLF